MLWVSIFIITIKKNTLSSKYPLLLYINILTTTDVNSNNNMPNIEAEKINIGYYSYKYIFTIIFVIMAFKMQYNLL